MVNRSRLVVWLTALGVVVVLAAGITAVIVRSTADDFPGEWDPRVLHLAQFVERERGALFDHPVHVDFLTPEEYSERTRTDEGALTDEEREELEQFEGTMRALGLLSSGADLLDSVNDLNDTGTLAYYDPAEERVVVRGTEVTPGLAVTLVHELTHVLQDQVFGLDRDDEDGEYTSGEIYAFGALVEGDADRIEARYVDTLDAAALAALDEESVQGLDEFYDADIPTALLALFGSTYGLGDAFVAALERLDGESVDGAFATPPVTEEQVFDPFEYLSARGPAPVDAPSTGGEEALDEGDFGAVSLMIVLAERIDPRQALRAATGWGGDAYAIFERDGRACVRLNVTGDTPTDTDELDQALTAWASVTPGGGASTARDGDIVSLESCDPGSAAAEGTGGSVVAVELAAIRTYIALDILDQGATRAQSRCVAAAVIDDFSDEELAAEELTPDQARRVASLARACR